MLPWGIESAKDVIGIVENSLSIIAISIALSALLFLKKT
jgi:hypothetical protein